MRSLRRAPPALPPLLMLLVLLVLLAAGHGAVITGACERDQQCGGGMCCAVSLWIRSLRMCTPMGSLGDECHPLSHRHNVAGGGWDEMRNLCPAVKRILLQGRSGKVPFPGRRTHHACPCLAGLACLRTAHSRFRCLPAFRREDVFF